MFVLNKLVWAFINPIALVFVCGAVGFVAVWFGRRWARWPLLASLLLLWFFASLAGSLALGLPLESPYWPEPSVESAPKADAILLLGGGMAVFPGAAHPDMNAAADRVWHAARLYKAGKAPLVVPTGVSDRASSVPLLHDLGVPDSVLAVEGAARNTEENIGCSLALLRRLTGKEHPKVLLVTSAWHMRRSLLNARLGGLDAVAAPCDYLANASFRSKPAIVRNWFLPDGQRLMESCVFAKEWTGILEKKILGRGSE